jgi:hypothetical protein
MGNIDAGNDHGNIITSGYKDLFDSDLYGAGRNIQIQEIWMLTKRSTILLVHPF